MLHTTYKTPDYLFSIEERMEAYQYAYNNVGKEKWFICQLLEDFIRMKKDIRGDGLLVVNISEAFPELAAYRPKKVGWGTAWFNTHDVQSRKLILQKTILDCLKQL